MVKWFLIFWTVGFSALGQSVIEGKVIDKETKTPIPFASVGIIGLPRGTSSNINGEFSLTVPAVFSLKVTCIGYESVVINSSGGDFSLIELQPVATHLDEIIVLAEEVNPQKVVRKAFARIKNNYNTKSFLQRFFYRQYSKTDSTYERLIEASIDVWKPDGYKTARSSAGEREAIRVNQLRRSLDIQGMVQSQNPISFRYVLQTDIAGYQAPEPREHLKFFDDVSNLKADFTKYKFTFDGVTRYDGEEVYKIHYQSVKDSILTTSGYLPDPSVSGVLFITTDTYAFVKTEELRVDGPNTKRTSGYYLKHKDKYYPYHFIREQESRFKGHYFSHVELMAVEIRHEESERFTGVALDRTDLLKIPFDSSFWSSSTILKTTPLEKRIILDLGGGRSLNKQFYLYKQYELNVTDGGNGGEQKFNWLRNESNGKRLLYIGFWDNSFKNYIVDMELLKRLRTKYGDKITFILVSLEDDDAAWQQLVHKFNFFSDGIINYRVGGQSKVAKEFGVRKTPAFFVQALDGKIHPAKAPSDTTLEEDLEKLIIKKLP